MLCFIGAFAASQQIRTAINITAVAAFFAYTGAGTEGTAGLGDYNLALDDSKQVSGVVVRTQIPRLDAIQGSLRHNPQD